MHFVRITGLPLHLHLGFAKVHPNFNLEGKAMNRMRFLVTASILAMSLAGAKWATAHDNSGSPKHTAVWFEIPVTDMARAIQFYGAVLQVKLEENKSFGVPMAFFPSERDAVSGALIKMDALKPSSDGPVVYLNGGRDLQVVLERVQPNGGKVLVPKTKISDEVGYFAIFLDTEGNRLGLFSPAGQ